MHYDYEIPAEYGAEPGWTFLPMPRSFGRGKSFVSGDVETDRVKIFYYRRDADGVLCAKLSVGYGAEGPTDHAHGGAMAAILDEAMGFSGWVTGHHVVAASITINFLKKLPLDRIVHLEAWVDASEDSKVSTVGRIFDPQTGHRYAEGQGLFIEQPLEYFGSLAAVRNMGGLKDAPGQ